MTTLLTPDICVIGAAPGGPEVAAAAAALGAPVLLVDPAIGVENLRRGPLPAMALLAAGKSAQAMREAGELGLEPVQPAVQRSRVNSHVSAVLKATVPHISRQRLTALGVQVITEPARFENRRILRAGDYEIKARRYVLATGMKPLLPDIPGLRECGYFTCETLAASETMPRHLIIVGGGEAGLEAAQAYRRLGARVTVLSAAPALRSYDREAANLLADCLRSEGIALWEETRVTRVDRIAPETVRAYAVNARGECRIDGSDILLAVGDRANTDDLGLDRAHIRHNERGVKVNDWLRTSNWRVFAVGAVTGRAPQPHIAAWQAKILARSLLLRTEEKAKKYYSARIVFTDPELAQTGQGEEEAAAANRRLRVLRYPFHEIDRAQAEGKTRGMIRILASRRGRILGASIVGPSAGELIQPWALAISKGMNLRDMLSSITPYPTYSEIGRRAIELHFAPVTRSAILRFLARLARRLG